MSITSDELNFLVYRYLQESGFVHSAFVFAYESLVGRANLATADIPPGALVNFIQKGLQYVEIERELQAQNGGSGLSNGVGIISGSKGFIGSKKVGSSKKGKQDSTAMDIDDNGNNNNTQTSSSSSQDNKQSIDEKDKQPTTTLNLEGKSGGDSSNNSGSSNSNNSDSAVFFQGGQQQEVSQADVTELKGHTAEVLICSWNPKSDLLASGSGDSTVRVWSIPRGPSGLPAGTAASESPLILNHVDSSDSQQENLSKDVTTLDWKADGQQLATGSYNGHARIWDLKGNLQHTLKCHKGTIFSMKWNNAGNYLLSGSVDKTAVVWDAATGTVFQQFENHEAPILDVDWRDNETFATCSTDKSVFMCKVGSPDPLMKFEGHQDEVNAIKWNPNGNLLASCSDDFSAKIWKPDQSSCVYSLNDHIKEIYQIKWSPTNENILATASFDTTIKTWDIEHGKCILSCEEHVKPVYSVAFSPCGKYIASGSMDFYLRIWSVNDGKCIKKYKGGGGIFEVCWNKDGDKVAACYGTPCKSVCVIDFRK